MRGAETAEEGVAAEQVSEARGCLVMKGFLGKEKDQGAGEGCRGRGRCGHGPGTGLGGGQQSSECCVVYLGLWMMT